MTVGASCPRETNAEQGVTVMFLALTGISLAP